MQEVMKKEIIRWYNAELVYHFIDSKWVSQVKCIPMKDGIIMVPNENYELIPIIPFVRLLVCTVYRKLSSRNRFITFLCLSSTRCYVVLLVEDCIGYSGCNQIFSTLKYYWSTTFTFLYVVFALKKMPFGLCETPATFHHCMIHIFYDFIFIFIDAFIK